MYRIIPLRILRRTMGVKFDEMVPSDIPKISGIDRVIHGPNSISPGPVEDAPVPVKRPWYMHPGQDDNLLVLQGTRYIDIFCSNTKTKAIQEKLKNIKIIENLKILKKNIQKKEVLKHPLQNILKIL